MNNTCMDKPSYTTTTKEPILLGDLSALKAIFPDDDTRPSPRAWRGWRAKGYYPYVRIGRRVFVNPDDARKALEARFTIEANH